MEIEMRNIDGISPLAEEASACFFTEGHNELRNAGLWIHDEDGVLIVEDYTHEGNSIGAEWRDRLIIDVPAAVKGSALREWIRDNASKLNDLLTLHKSDDLDENEKWDKMYELKYELEESAECISQFETIICSQSDYYEEWAEFKNSESENILVLH